MIISENTKLKEVIDTPVGHDIIARVLYSIGLDEDLLKGPLGLIKIETLKTLSLGKIDDDFIKSILLILNSEKEIIEEDDCDVKKEWWKEAVFYEIYPRSFKDTNGDGIGDIKGIIEKLDYLKNLGVDALWIAPFYDSPNADNGYDVRDYKKIMKEFGTMKDVERLFSEVHKRGMRIIIDLVMNHTSDEHEWFKKFLNGDKKYKDYYIHKKQENIPNNWTSLFSGSAWDYYDEIKSWVLHLFSKKQIDLNWDNKAVREEMFDIALYWLKKGADGFRLDVVSFISKTKGLPKGNEKLGRLTSFTGVEHYFHGPNLDKYLKQFSKKCLIPYNAYTVGECPGNGLKMSRLIAGDDRCELSQLFSFDHIENPGKTRLDIYDFDLRKMIPELVRWQTQYSNHCWPTLFFDNHDTPRMVAKINKDSSYHERIGKLLATLLFTLKGTPYLYQGCELAMNNYPFKSLDEVKDIESLQYYQKHINEGKDKDLTFKRLLYGSRDQARTPMCWNNSKNAGFTSGVPWMKVNPDYKKVNVASELKDKDSCLNYHKNLIGFRKEHKALIYGTFKKIKTNKNIFAYYREKDSEKYLIVMNLTSKDIRCNIKGEKILFSNYKEHSNVLRAYETIIYEC